MATAEEHLARAKQFAEKADLHSARASDYYEKTAKEIVAARKADATLTLREVDRRLGRGNSYAGRLVKWYESGAPRSTSPFARGSSWRSRSGGDDEWYTRPEYIEAAREVLGHIDLDPATSDAAQKTVKATRYFTKKDDGLAHEWSGRVWMNPPYGRNLVDRFTDKLLTEYRSGNVTAAVMVVSAYSYDTNWFKPFWNYVICFGRTRSVFYKLDPEGNPMSGDPSVGAAFVYLGEDSAAFRKAFGKFGKFAGEDIAPSLAEGRLLAEASVLDSQWVWLAEEEQLFTGQSTVPERHLFDEHATWTRETLDAEWAALRAAEERVFGEGAAEESVEPEPADIPF